MAQDSTSGAAAARWGRVTGQRIAAKLGGTPVSRQANEFVINGRRVAVKTARARTLSVGVTYLVLARVDDVYGAWEVAPDAFEIWSLTAPAFKEHMRATASRGPSAGRVGIVNRKTFEANGVRVGHIVI